MIQKSPFTGGNIKLITENRDFMYKGELITIPYSYYLCEDTKEQFTTTELDERNMQRLRHLYSSQHSIQYSLP